MEDVGPPIHLELPCFDDRRFVRRESRPGRTASGLFEEGRISAVGGRGGGRGGIVVGVAREGAGLNLMEDKSQMHDQN